MDITVEFDLVMRLDAIATVDVLREMGRVSLRAYMAMISNYAKNSEEVGLIWF